MNTPPAFVKKLITLDEWKLICQIRQAEVCRKKISYMRESEAWAEAVRISSQLGNGRPPSRPYKCEVCDRWHLTTKKLNNTPQQPK
jgi:hypothetical protein